MTPALRLMKVAVVVRQPRPNLDAYLGCPCGAQPATTVDGPDVACQCGRLYAANGWLITEHYAGQLASWQDEPAS